MQLAQRTQEPLRGPSSVQQLSQPILYLAEDDDDIRDTLTALFIRDGFAVRSAPDGARLFRWLFCNPRSDAPRPDVIITDHRMPGYCSLDILESLEQREWTIPVIVITAYGPEVQDLARLHGAQAVLEKPFDPDDLRMATMHCVNWRARCLKPPDCDRPGHVLVARARRAIRFSVDDTRRPPVRS